MMIHGINVVIVEVESTPIGVCKIKNDFLCDQWELMEARNHECERE